MSFIEIESEDAQAKVVLNSSYDPNEHAFTVSLEGYVDSPYSMAITTRNELLARCRRE